MEKCAQWWRTSLEEDIYRGGYKERSGDRAEVTVTRLSENSEKQSMEIPISIFFTKFLIHRRNCLIKI